ncbi:MAG: flagellar hook-basal body complex protein [Acidobacteria bacterium]|nr:flagellar hook-basal body complex protein [Acidobacteriota bacterium]
MNPAILSAASGMVARGDSLQALSNNLANTSTVGYKADLDFYRAFQGALSRPGSDGLGQALPYAEGAKIDFRQGPLMETGSPLNVALRGPGFLELNGEIGPMYTRAGELTVAPDGTLLGPAGLPVASQEGDPIVIPPNGPISIDEIGVVRAGETIAGRIKIVEFSDPPPLAKAGGQLLRPLSEDPPEPAAETTLQPGYLEAANVGVPESFARLLSVTRHFEMLRRTATLAGDDIDGRALDTLPKTS